MLHFCRLLAVLTIASFTSHINAKENLPATYSVTVESWAPYWIVEKDRVEGILSEVMLALDLLIPNHLEAIKPLPVKRAKHLFKVGEIQIECCVNEAWREEPEQFEVSLWSDLVMPAEEVLIFPRGKVFPFNSLIDLKGKQVATMLGYGYVGDEYFTRNDVLKNTSLIKMVAGARVDGGIIDKFELAHAVKYYPELAGIMDDVEIGPVINRSELKIRIHRSRSDLLPIINKGIATLRANGEMQKIIDRYVGRAD